MYWTLNFNGKCCKIKYNTVFCSSNFLPLSSFCYPSIFLWSRVRAEQVVNPSSLTDTYSSNSIACIDDSSLAPHPHPPFPLAGLESMCSPYVAIHVGSSPTNRPSTTPPSFPFSRLSLWFSKGITMTLNTVVKARERLIKKSWSRSLILSIIIFTAGPAAWMSVWWTGDNYN